MMEKLKNNIKFYFPEKKLGEKALVNFLISKVNKDKRVQNAGLQNLKDFREDLEWRFENASTEKYKPLSESAEKRLRKISEAALKKSTSKLQTKHENIFILIFPWLPPFDEFDERMGYVSGFAAGNGIINLYVEPEKFSEDSLISTIAHEYNHLVFFENHPSLNPDLPENTATIRDVLIWEGLAENFSEEITGQKVSPIIGNLTKKEAREALEKAKDKLSVKISNDEETVYQEVFFGLGGEYKRWSGYSIGYFIIKKFLNKHPDLSWQGIINMEPKKIYADSPFTDY